MGEYPGESSTTEPLIENARLTGEMTGRAGGLDKLAEWLSCRDKDCIEGRS